jgi:hypothetical protein
MFRPMMGASAVIIRLFGGRSKEKRPVHRAAVVRKDWAEAERLALEDEALFAACTDWLERYMLAYADFMRACPCPDCATRH